MRCLQVATSWSTPLRAVMRRRRMTGAVQEPPALPLGHYGRPPRHVRAGQNDQGASCLALPSGRASRSRRMSSAISSTSLATLGSSPRSRSSAGFSGSRRSLTGDDPAPCREHGFGLNSDLGNSICRAGGRLQVDKYDLEFARFGQAALQLPDEARLAHSPLCGQPGVEFLPHPLRQRLEFRLAVEEILAVDPIAPAPSIHCFLPTDLMATSMLSRMRSGLLVSGAPPGPARARRISPCRDPRNADAGDLQFPLTMASDCPIRHRNESTGRILSAGRHPG